MANLKNKAEAWLADILGKQATFRAGQWEAIDALVVQRQHVLVVQRTGWGKSSVYFLATRLLREQGHGLTVLISPLLALMRNQIEAAQQWGLVAETLNSSNQDDHARIESALLANKVDLLLISPERLGNDRFYDRVWSRLRSNVGMLVIDEAHCISDWGHDFRPNYRRIMHILEDIPHEIPVLGTTATANDRVVSDVAEIIGAGMNIQRGALTRDSLSLYTYPEYMDTATKLTLLSHLLSSIGGSGIIYCTTTRDCLLVSEWLQKEGHNVKPYFSNVEATIDEDRIALEDQLMNNQVKALASSVALGMGFDKSDLSFVIHYQLPGNLISYYQQIGRAGRGIERAYVILMHGEGDEDIQRFFIDTAFPSVAQVESVINALKEFGAMSRNNLLGVVNVRISALEKILVHLEVEEIIGRQGSKYHLQKADATPDFARWKNITESRYQELAQMKTYVHSTDCLMRFIATELDDPNPVVRCGKCKNCTEAQSKFQPSTQAIARAQRFLRHGDPITFEPRKRFPMKLDGYRNTIIPHINQTGLAVCEYYDSGLGERVRQGRKINTYDESLLDASVET
ncbi:MAG: RecQ family ATP-dependent DNA helicase, partial [Aggregatilineales bacterium]